VQDSAKRWTPVRYCLGMAALAMILTACRNDPSGAGPTDTATATTTATATASTAAGSPADSPGTGTAGDRPQWTMPELRGAGLQAAQDRIQALTGDAIFFTSSHDVSGRGRHQILDRDWQVCSQNVAAGTPIGVGTKIDFGVVKTSEQCP